MSLQWALKCHHLGFTALFRVMWWILHTHCVASVAHWGLRPPRYHKIKAKKRKELQRPTASLTSCTVNDCLSQALCNRFPCAKSLLSVQKAIKPLAGHQCVFPDGGGSPASDAQQSSNVYKYTKVDVFHFQGPCVKTCVSVITSQEFLFALVGTNLTHPKLCSIATEPVWNVNFFFFVYILNV